MTLQSLQLQVSELKMPVTLQALQCRWMRQGRLLNDACVAGSKAAKAAPSPVPPALSDNWDAALDSVTGVLQQLSTQDATAAGKLEQRLADAKQALLVPQHIQMLHRHAVRLLVQQAADSIDTAAESAKQVMLQRKE